MKNKVKLIVLALMLFSAFSLVAADKVAGLWMSIDDETGDTSSICMLYEKGGKLYGRLMVTYDQGVLKDTIYDQNDKAELIVGDPYFAGMDFIWDLKDTGKKWSKGKILDPPNGKIYSSEVWLDKKTGDLIVRGKIGPFGRNQTWKKVGQSDLPAGFKIPDSGSFKPVIPKVK